VCANCNELATLLEEVELKTMNVPHWSSVIHPQTPGTMKRMDDGVTFLLGDEEPPCTYFQEGDFAYLHFGKGTGQGMLSCLLAVIKGNSNTDLLESILKSDVDEKIPKYSRFDIPDSIILLCLRTYLRTHGRSILTLVTSEPDRAPIPSTVNDLTVHDLARYLSFQRWKDTSAEERREATQHLRSKEVQDKKRDNLVKHHASKTTEERIEATQHLRSEEVQAKKREVKREVSQSMRDAQKHKHDAQWTSNFNKLDEFNTVNGHIDVPKGHELYDWTITQRRARNNPRSECELSAERIALLDGLGFEWNPREASWTSKFKTLEAFKAVNGHLNLPRNHELYGWASKQRSLMKKDELCKERIALLNGLGFV
jgi:hypothetical protein